MEEVGYNSLEIVKSRICPDCNIILTASYTSTKFTYLCSLFLCIGMACWAPWVIDGCKKIELYCEKCDKKVLELEPHCLCL